MTSKCNDAQLSTNSDTKMMCALLQPSLTTASKATESLSSSTKAVSVAWYPAVTHQWTPPSKTGNSDPKNCRRSSFVALRGSCDSCTTPLESDAACRGATRLLRKGCEGQWQCPLQTLLCMLCMQAKRQKLPLGVEGSLQDTSTCSSRLICLRDHKQLSSVCRAAMPWADPALLLHGYPVAPSWT